MRAPQGTVRRAFFNCLGFAAMTVFCAQPTQALGLQEILRIIVLQSGASTNDVKVRAETSLVIQVQDPNGPVRGAQVTFKLPLKGASGIFPNGSTTISVTTDPSGIAKQSF